MADNNVKDWEYDDSFYSGDTEKKVRSFEEIAAECEGLMENPIGSNMSKDSEKLNELAEKVGKIKKLSSEGTDVYRIAEILDFDSKFVSDVLITISGSPEDDSDMAIAHLLSMDYQP